MRGLNRLLRRLRPAPRGDYANDGFPVEHPRPRPVTGLTEGPEDAGGPGSRRSPRGS